jgi:hypothetical protein
MRVFVASLIVLSVLYVWDKDYNNGRLRSAERKSLKARCYFFNEKTGVHSCTVRDVTNLGAGIRAQNLQIIPLNFALSFDNFRTVRMCRLIWRQAEFLGVSFES